MLGTGERRTLRLRRSHRRGANDPEADQQRSTGALREKPGLVLTQALMQQQQALAAFDAMVVVALVVAAATVRLWKIGNGSMVTWDESHFGRFGAMYLNKTLIHDVHPPLGKMVIALVEHLAGHNGTFTFPGAATYPVWVEYKTMRALLSVFGTSLVPMAYITSRLMDVSREMSILAAVFVLFDNALCLMSRLITLDGMLFATTALVLLCLIGLMRSRQDLRWMTATGVSLGLVMSVKWTGVFSVGIVGMCVAQNTLVQAIAGKPWRLLLRQVSWYALCLLVIPAAIYATVFRVHFAYQTERGVGEHLLPVRFQSQLIGNRFNRQPCSVAFGAATKILPRRADLGSNAGLQVSRIKDRNTTVPWRVGCKEVITGADWWSLRHPIGVVANYTDGPVEYLRHGALVTVVNDLSTRLLCVDSSAESQQPASDPIPVVAVATDRNNSGGLQAQGGNGGAEWVVEIASYEMRGAMNIAPSDNITDWDPEVLHPLATLFRLRHAATGCVLAALPAAASDDTNVGAPVVCVPDPLRTGVDGAAVDDLWRVTLSVDLRIGFESNMRGKVRTSFTENLFALNAVMARANNDLVPDPDRYDVLESPPWSWPFLIYPMRMGGWYRAEEAMEHGAYYEIGNPLLWWATATLCCVLYPLRAAVALYSWKRARKPIRVGAGWLLWSGWAMHYLPFFLMSRITYLHHYLPALYYALLLLAYECDKLATRCGGRSARRALLVVLSLLVFAVFWNFRICTFGWYGQPPAAGLARLRWLPSWNIAGSAYD